MQDRKLASEPVSVWHQQGKPHSVPSVEWLTYITQPHHRSQHFTVVFGMGVPNVIPTEIDSTQDGQLDHAKSVRTWTGTGTKTPLTCISNRRHACGSANESK